MGLTKEQKREYQREYMRKKRSNIEDGSNSVGLTNEGSNKEGLTYPDILDKLTDPKWRENLTKVCTAFKNSHHPDYMYDVWLGVDDGVSVVGSTNLSVACDWLACTS